VRIINFQRAQEQETEDFKEFLEQFEQQNLPENDLKFDKSKFFSSKIFNISTPNCKT